MQKVKFFSHRFFTEHFFWHLLRNVILRSGGILVESPLISTTSTITSLQIFLVQLKRSDLFEDDATCTVIKILIGVSNGVLFIDGANS